MSKDKVEIVGAEPAKEFATPREQYLAGQNIEAVAEAWKGKGTWSYSKVIRTCKEEGWNLEKKIALRKSEEKERKLAGKLEPPAQRVARHLTIARAAQRLGLRALENLEAIVREGVPMKPADAIKAAVEGVRLERLILGESTENVAAIVVRVREEVFAALKEAGMQSAVPVVESRLQRMAGGFGDASAPAAAVDVEFSFRALERGEDGEVRVTQYGATVKAKKEGEEDKDGVRDVQGETAGA